MINKIIIASLALILMPGFLFSQKAPLKFDERVQKFGKVEEGQDINLVYTFVNQSDRPIIINDTKVNCSCTRAEFPKSPINPGGSGAINVYFHTLGKIGYQERTIQILTSMGTTEIVFKGVVKSSAETKDEYRKRHTHDH